MKKIIVGLVSIMALSVFNGCSGQSSDEVSKEFAKKVESLMLEGKFAYIANEPQTKFIQHQNLGKYIEDLMDGYITNGAKIDKVIEVEQKDDKYDTRFKQVSAAVGVLAAFSSKNIANMILTILQVQNMGKDAIGKMITEKDVPEYNRQYQSIINCKYGKYFNLNK